MKIQAKIDRVLKSGKIKAIASVSLDGMFVVKGLKVMDGKKGLFVSMPQEVFTGNDGKKQYSICCASCGSSIVLEYGKKSFYKYHSKMKQIIDL